MAFSPVMTERERWNERFRRGSSISQLPETFFVESYQEYVVPLLSGTEHKRVLDVACGAGRHGLWLAERGWRVTLVDVASEGLAMARRHARGRNLDVEFVEQDLQTVESAASEGWTSQFDLVLVFFYLQRELFPVLADALRPGGLLLYKTYTERQAQFASGPSDPRHRLASGELLEAFPYLQTLFYRETVRERGVAELVAQQP